MRELRKVGHLARDCRSRKDGNYKKPGMKQKKDYDVFLMSLNVDIEDVWILDSGCTHHVCKRRDWFTNFREMDSEVINTAADPSKQSGATLRAKGIKHERSNVETPQMNGVAERINRTLLDLTRSMLKSTCLPQRFWAEAVTTAAYIKNRVCHSTINDQIPFTVWTERVPSVRHLKRFMVA
ncbi:uncharacterized protein LOC143902223 [Temnothorax americanus]|uniref:uncharacterized protein LOC143902223 n=1 Tax=Temnothorax americanus TaxID=1964332 RepID=UPI00406813B0